MVKVGIGEGPEVSLIGVRVPNSFHRRVLMECCLRDMTLKELVTNALKAYFLKTHFHTSTGRKSEATADRRVWMGVWSSYIVRMPREKIEVIAKAMEWDLKMLKSSRRKTI